MSSKKKLCKSRI